MKNVTLPGRLHRAATMFRCGRLWMRQAAFHSCVKIEYNSEYRHARW
jgi:hypothetical protein